MFTILPLAVGLPACSIGVALMIFSSVKGAQLRQFVVRNALAPEATKSYYLARFRMPEVLAAYERATGDRASVRVTYVTGALGVVSFVAGGLMAASALPS